MNENVIEFETNNFDNLEWVINNAEQGDVVAQKYLADCDLSGKGVEQDFSKAIHWYSEAASQGEKEAMYNLGVFYSNGIGVEADSQKALEWYVKAAYVTENRLTNVVSHIGEVHVPKDFGKIMGLFSKDVLEDFLKEHGGDYSALDKSEQKLLNKELNKLATVLVKKVYMSQAYIL